MEQVDDIDKSRYEELGIQLYPSAPAPSTSSDDIQVQIRQDSPQKAQLDRCAAIVKLIKNNYSDLFKLRVEKDTLDRNVIVIEDNNGIIQGLIRKMKKKLKSLRIVIESIENANVDVSANILASLMDKNTMNQVSLLAKAGWSAICALAFHKYRSSDKRWDLATSKARDSRMQKNINFAHKTIITASSIGALVLLFL